MARRCDLAQLVLVPGRSNDCFWCLMLLNGDSRCAWVVSVCADLS